MTFLACHGWWFVAGLFIGALLSWLLHWLLWGRGPTGGPRQDPEPVTPPPSGTTTQSPSQYSQKSRGDQLEAIEGVGVKIAEVLRDQKILTFAELANRTPSELREMLNEAGSRFDLAHTTTWPQQARLLADGNILGFMELTDRLKGGVDPSKNI